MKVPAWLRTEVAGLGVSIAATAVLTSVLAPIQDRVGLLNEGLLLLLLALLVSATWGWRVSHPAIRSADAAWCRSRTPMVRRPRSAS